MRYVCVWCQDAEGRIRFAFETVLSRPPSDGEMQVVKRAVERELADWQARADAAKDVLAVGESPRDEQLDAAQHAAWQQVATLILNLSETITKE